MTSYKIATQKQSSDLLMARDLALQSISQWPDPVGKKVHYHSQGVCLIFGSLPRVSTALNQINSNLKVLAIAPGLERSQKNSNLVRTSPGIVCSVNGYLGAFSAKVQTGSTATDLGPMSQNRNGLFDLILDLGDTALINHEVLPLGYRYLGDENLAAVKEIMEGFEKKLGDSYKPKYYHYDKQLCAHDRRSVSGCHRCIDACPAGAIQSEADSMIKVDSYLCQGCGSCTSECPTGALAFPNYQTILLRIHQLIEGFNSISGKFPAICFYQENSFQDNSYQSKKSKTDEIQQLSQALAENMIAFPLPALGALSLEILLACLVMKAISVKVLITKKITPSTKKLLQTNINQTHKILKKLKLPVSYIDIITKKQIKKKTLKVLSKPISSSYIVQWDKLTDKREVLRESLKSLTELKEFNAIKFDHQGYFGGVIIDQKKCTFCLSCTLLCPTQALHAKAENLLFKESNCVQCGLCDHGCPENAIQLEPRLDGAFISKHETKLFTNVELAFCTHCGKSFGSMKLMEKGIKLMKKIPNFNNEQLSLLKMCPECRQNIHLTQSRKNIIG